MKSLFDLVDQMEELDETLMSDSNISDHDFSDERKVGLHVSSTNNQFTGIGYVLAPAPEAKKRRKYAHDQKLATLGVSARLQEISAQIMSKLTQMHGGLL